MNGKGKCKILKEIRRQIAAQNDIEFVTADCKFQGDCTGTCPKCEAEVRYLEEQLRKRQQAGKAIAVAGIAAALVVTSSGCMPVQTGGDPLPNSSASPTESTDDILMGVPETLPTSSTETTEGMDGYVEPPMGDIPPESTDPTEPWEGEIPDELMGDPVPEGTEDTEPTEPVDTRLPPYNDDETMGYIA